MKELKPGDRVSFNTLGQNHEAQTYYYRVFGRGTVECVSSYQNTVLIIDEDGRGLITALLENCEKIVESMMESEIPCYNHGECKRDVI